MWYSWNLNVQHYPSFIFWCFWRHTHKYIPEFCHDFGKFALKEKLIWRANHSLNMDKLSVRHPQYHPLHFTDCLDSHHGLLLWILSLLRLVEAPVAREKQWEPGSALVSRFLPSLLCLRYKTITMLRLPPIERQKEWQRVNLCVLYVIMFVLEATVEQWRYNVNMHHKLKKKTLKCGCQCEKYMYVVQIVW